MSLGSSFGTTDDPSAVASTNAAKAGVIVVTSAGNSGPNAVHHRLARHGRRRDLDRRERPDAERSRARTSRCSSGTTLHGDQRERVTLRPAATRVGVIEPITIRRSDDAAGTARRTSRSAAPSPTLRHRCAPAQIAVVEPRHLRARGEGDLRPAGRRRRGGDDQQRDRPCRRSRARSRATRTRASRYNVTIPFLGRRGACATTPTSDGGKLRARQRARRRRVDADGDREPELQGLRELLVGRPAER